MNDVREGLAEIFRQELGFEPPAADTDIVAAGLLDSLALVTLLFEVEQQFGVRIPLEDLDIDSLRTIDRIVELIEGLAPPPHDVGADLGAGR